MTVAGGHGPPPTGSRARSCHRCDPRGNLPMTVDFRQMYATALEGWLGVDAQPILGSGFTPLPLLA